MVGQLYVPGEQKVLSGVYFRRTNIGTPPIAGATMGRVAAIFRAPWGPLGSTQLLASLSEIDQYYGTGLGTDVPRQALLGKPLDVLGMRVGAGGAIGSRTLVDTTGGPINAVTLPNRYAGDRAIYTTVRNSPSDVTLRELLVYELIGGVYTLRETITFLAGAGGGGEPQKLVDAVNGVTPGKTASRWVGPAVKLADGNGILAAYSQQAQAGGANPASLAADYTAAMVVLETQAWDVLVVDTADTAILASVRAYVDQLRTNGVLVMAAIGEPTSVAIATRIANAAAHNDPPIVYAGNGFLTSDAITAEGYLAAARIGGKIAGTPSNQAITWSVVDGAISVVGALDLDDKIAAKNAGMLFFDADPDGNIVAAEGITTFHVATADLDLGWGKIRRVRARDEYMRRVGRSWARVVGRLQNNADGRSTLLGMAQAVAAEMINEQKLLSVEAFEDPAYPAAGDTVTFLAAIVDLDSVEKIYMAFGFQFGGQ